MGFTTVKKKYASPTSRTDEGGRSSAVIYLVQADATTETATSAKTAVGDDGNSVPRYGDPHPEDWAQKVTSIGSEHLSDLWYLVEVEYQTPPGLGADPDQDNPLTARAEIQIGYAVSTEPIDEDIDGEVICNKLREPFDPPLTEEIHDRQITITQNQADFNMASADSYENHVNADSFLGWPPGTVLCNGINAVRIVEKDRTYWRVSAVFTFRKPRGGQDAADVWKRRVLNAGFQKRYKDANGLPVKDATTPSGWKTCAIKDAEKQPVTEPQPLGAFGDPLGESESALWLNFKTKHSRSFGSLQLRI